MNKGITSLFVDEGEVTILFCDIYDFDNIINQESTNIINPLSIFLL